MAGITIYPYQEQWLKDKSRFKIGMQARQTGKTFTNSLEIVDDCFEELTKGRRARWIILSAGERQAKEIIREGIIPHARAYSLAIEQLEYEWQGQQGSYNVLEVTLPGDSRIMALPANPDTARGFSGNVFLDEFSRHQRDREIWGALFPVISAGFKIRIAGTPNGKGNKFYEIMTDENSIWSCHQTNIYQAVAQGLPRNIEELKRGLNDEDLWKQEYELEWLDEAEAWLDYDLISACEDARAGRPEFYEGGLCFLGNDIGRRSNLWVCWVWELVGDVLWCREIKTLKRQPFSVQDDALDELMSRYKVVRLAMDQTGMGEKPVEDAQRRYGKYLVEGLIFSGASKQHLATLIKQTFEDRRARIPMGDRVLRSDLHKVRKITTPLGHIRFDADNDANGHADRFWAGALGVYAASEMGETYRSPGSRSLDNW